MYVSHTLRTGFQPYHIYYYNAIIGYIPNCCMLAKLVPLNLSSKYQSKFQGHSVKRI